MRRRRRSNRLRVHGQDEEVRAGSATDDPTGLARLKKADVVKVGDGCLPNIKEMESLIDFDRAVLTRRGEAAGLLDISLGTATPSEAMFTAPGVGPVILESKGHLRCLRNHRLL